MSEPSLFFRVIPLVGVGVIVAGVLLWLIVTGIRDYVGSARDMRRGLQKLPAILAHHKAQCNQHEALLEIGFTEHELQINHSVVADRETGLPTIVYHISHDAIEARAASTLRRRAALVHL